MADEHNADDQDMAEIFDETNLTPDGDDIANADELPDLLDVTSAVGDADDEDEDPDAEIDWDDVGPDQEDEDEDGADPVLRTQLEDQPETEGAVVGGAALDDEGVSTEDQAASLELESAALSDRQLKTLGYKR